MHSCGATRSCKVRKVALRNHECRERLCRLNVLCGHTHQQEEVRSISSGRKSIYGPSVSPFLEESPYMDRRSVHFWKKVTLRKSICGPHGPYLKAPCCLERLGKTSILGTCSWKNEHCSLGNKVKTNNFLKMAPQAEPLCSYDLYRNSE